MLKKFRNILLIFFQITILVYILILIFLYFYQRNLMYHPNENNYSDDPISVNIEKVKIKTDDKIELLGWYHRKDLKKLPLKLERQFSNAYVILNCEQIQRYI